MRKIHWLVLIIVLTILSVIILINSNTPEDIIKIIKEDMEPMPNIEIIDAIWVETRVIVQAEYTGSQSEAPPAAVHWHELARLSAEKIYQSLNERHIVELQLFYNQEFRAVAVVGL